MNDPRYPIGKHDHRQSYTPEERSALIDTVAAAPLRMRDAVRGLDERQLDTPYREGGWTVRQVVHHVPDSHINAYVRLKLALTEDVPTIQPYNEAVWAAMADSRDTPIETSLTLLDSLHGRWSTLMRSMKDADFARRLTHPERGTMTVDWLLGLYAWHGRHHAGHITSLRERERWT